MVDATWAPILWQMKFMEWKPFAFDGRGGHIVGYFTVLGIDNVKRIWALRNDRLWVIHATVTLDQWHISGATWSNAYTARRTGKTKINIVNSGGIGRLVPPTADMWGL